MTTAQPPAREPRPKPRQGPRDAAWQAPAWLRRLGSACQTTLGLGVLSSLLLWLAFPPIGFAPAVWVAPVPLLLLIRQQHLSNVARSLHDRHTGHGVTRPHSRHAILRVLFWLPLFLIRVGRRPYGALWYSGFLFWFLVLHWLRLPHWAGYFSWPALSALMANYTPLFVALSRVMVHRWRVSIVLACPVVWTGLELLRAHVLGGFGMANLGQAHYRWLALIQISDLAGAYAVSFVVMLVAACLARVIPWQGRRAVAWPVIPAAAAVAATLAYGFHRLDTTDETSQPPRPEVNVAIIQVSFDTEFVFRPERPKQLYRALMKRSREALALEPELDLIIWPETLIGVFDVPQTGHVFLVGLTDEKQRPPPPSLIAGQLNQGGTRASLILGADVTQVRPEKRGVIFEAEYNASLFMAPGGGLAGRYDKMNPVMFGEYVPLGEYLPWLYRFSPLRKGLTAGTRPASFEVEHLRFCPSICYESILPHHVRDSVTTLRAEGREPDVLVNQTNSGWFWGSSELELHLICNVFRAVECRKPMLVAANTGISAWIDDTGRIRQQGPRRGYATLHAKVSRSSRKSAYLTVGDWPAGLCLAICVLAAMAGFLGIWQRRRLSSSGTAV